MMRENDGVNAEQFEKIMDAALSLKQSVDPEKLPFLDYLVDIILIEIEEKTKFLDQTQSSSNRCDV